MNGNAINQVLLNLPKSGNQAAKNVAPKDAASPDFAQTFQDAHKTQAKPKSRSNANDMRATDRQAKSAQADNSPARRNDQAHENRRQDRAQRPSEKPPVEHAAHTKSASRQGKASSTNDADAQVSPQTATADKATADKPNPDGQVANTPAAEPEEVNLNNTDEADALAAISPLTTSEPTNETAAALAALTQLLAAAQGGAVNEPVAGSVDNASLVAESEVAGESPDQAISLLEAVATTDKIRVDAVLGQGPGGEVSEDTLPNGTVAPIVGNSQSPAASLLSGTAATAATAQQNTTELPVPGTLASAMANHSITAATTTVNQTALAATAEVVDQADALIAQAVSLLKPETQATEGKAATAGDEITMTTDNSLLEDASVKGSPDKISFDKMLKTMAQSSLGEAAPREALTVPATQSSSTGSALDYLARASESQGTSSLRNFVVQTSVAVPVGQPQWSQAVGEKVLWLAAQNISSAELNLNPLDLGPVQVKVNVNQDQANVTFTSHHPVVREVIDQNLNRLREMFSEQGLNLVNVDVSDKSFQRHQGEAKDQQGQGGNNNQDEEETVAAVSVIKPQRLVDHYA